MPQNIYTLENVKYAYGEKRALCVEKLSIESSSIVGLMGPNGSGKSTLLKLLAFVEKPSSGKILYKGKPAAPFSRSVRFQVTLLTQDPYLMRRSVFDNVSYGLRLRGERKDMDERVAEALSLVGLAPEFAQRSSRELSGGEAQRVALAARLALKPEALLLDEPTASVDARSGQFIREASLNARERWGTTLVIASHDLQWLHGICDRTCHMHRGVVFGTGLETLVFGPWRRLSENRWAKDIDEDRKVVVTAPPSEDAAAVLGWEKIRLSDAAIRADGDNCIKGVVSRLAFQKSADRIVGTVVAGNVPFTVRLSEDQITRSGLIPGKEVYISFKPDDAEWISG